jgi:hypothetical protein
MDYRKRDPLEKVAQPPQTGKQSGAFAALRQAVRDALMRRVSTKR